MATYTCKHGVLRGEDRRIDRLTDWTPALMKDTDQ